MNIEYIKVGETYNVRVKVVKKETARVCCHAISKNGNCFSDFHSWFSKAETAAFSPITPETAPKYAPCRLFKEGDIVEPCSVNGRWCSHVWEDRSGIHYEVAKDEDPLTAHMEVKDPDSPHPFLVHAAFFKLVTPVGELEPYLIEESNDGATKVLTVKKRGCSQGIDFRYCPGWGGNVFLREIQQRQHAEAERDRLNAEYRKENLNDY